MGIQRRFCILILGGTGYHTFDTVIRLGYYPSISWYLHQRNAVVALLELVVAFFLNRLMAPSHLILVVVTKSIFESLTYGAAAYWCFHLFYARTFVLTGRLSWSLDAIWPCPCCGGFDYVRPNNAGLIWLCLVGPIPSSKLIDHSIIVVEQFSPLVKIINSGTRIWTNAKVNDCWNFIITFMPIYSFDWNIFTGT